MTDVVIRQETDVAISNEKLIAYLDALGIVKELDESQKMYFVEIAQAFQLNPFKREIHPAVYWDSIKGKKTLSVITGYEVYIKRAERSGKLRGWRSGIRNPNDPMKSWVGYVEIKKDGWDEMFCHEVYFDEVAQFKKDGTLTSFWKRAPRFQLKKVAISQGFRLAFPDELGGIPYTADELPDDMAGREPKDVTPETEKVIHDRAEKEFGTQKEQLAELENTGLTDPGTQPESPKEDKKAADLKKFMPEILKVSNAITDLANQYNQFLSDKEFDAAIGAKETALHVYETKNVHPIEFLHRFHASLDEAVKSRAAQNPELELTN